MSIWWTDSWDRKTETDSCSSLKMTSFPSLCFCSGELRSRMSPYGRGVSLCVCQVLYHFPPKSCCSFTSQSAALGRESNLHRLQGWPDVGPHIGSDPPSLTRVTNCDPDLAPLLGQDSDQHVRRHDCIHLKNKPEKMSNIFFLCNQRCQKPPTWVVTSKILTYVRGIAQLLEQDCKKVRGSYSRSH